MDALLTFDPTTYAMGLQLDAGQLGADESLQTAVLLSLFSHGRTRPEETPQELPLGGWWADSLADVPLGSKLRLLLREKTSNETRLRAEAYVREALQWLLVDGVASDVAVEASYFPPGKLSLLITLTRPTGEQLDIRINDLWEALSRAN